MDFFTAKKISKANYFFLYKTSGKNNDIFLELFQSERRNVVDKEHNEVRIAADQDTKQERNNEIVHNDQGISKHVWTMARSTGKRSILTRKLGY